MVVTRGIPFFFARGAYGDGMSPFFQGRGKGIDMGFGSAVIHGGGQQ